MVCDCLHQKYSARVLRVAQILCLLLFSVAVPGQSGNEIVYVYDELGRLVAVIDTAGDAAVYTYDAVGNLLTIARYSAATVSIIEFTPNSGPVGAAVTIYGTGFSTTPSQNTVTFNGVAATVTAATTTKITTTVPVGATTGPIAITTPAGNASSSTPFVVGGSGLPTITDFTPTIGVSGAPVTITGTNFEPAAANNKSRFNVTYSSITSATSTTIATTVPSQGTSGRISVSTPAGTAISSADFFVPPPPYTAADVAATGRMVYDESKTVSLGTANKIGLIVFDGIAGQRASIKVTSSTINSTVLTVRSPTGVSIGSVTANTSGGFLETSTLPMNGTYTILVDPSSTNTGNITFTLYNVTDLLNTITINGPAVEITIASPGQNARLTFAGTAGQRVSVGLSAMTLGVGYCCEVGSISLLKPDGTTLQAPVNFNNAGAGTASMLLPVSGTYAIFIDPSQTRTGVITVTLSEDLASPISINGSAVNLTYRIGQNARLPFEGTAGQWVSVGLSDMTLGVGYCCEVGSIWLLKPDGTTLQAAVNFGNAGAGTASVLLPVSGTYAIVIDPSIHRSGLMTVRLSGDLTTPITINGPAVNLNFNPGQNARLPFEGTAGQRVSVGLSDMTLGVGYCCEVGSISLLKPDGTVLQAAVNFSNAGAGTASVLLPVSGTYAIFIDPSIHRSGAMTVTLSEDLAPPISINGSAVNLTYRIGQNARLPFEGTAGQWVSVGLSDMTLGVGYCCEVGSIWLLKPDGTTLQAAVNFGNAGAGTASVLLPVSGTYAIVIDPSIHRSGLMTVRLSGDLTTPITINGPAVNLNFNPGQNARLPFEGTAGQRVSVGLSDMTLGVGYCCEVGSISLLKPDGTVLQAAVNFSNAGAGTASVLLPVSGTYAIFIDPSIHRSGAMTVTLSEDIASPISINGSAVNLTYRIGQNARLPFEGTAGQRVSVGLSDMTLGVGYCCEVGSISLLKPDGTVLQAAVNFSNAGAGTASVLLPVSGTYAIFIDPSIHRSGVVTVTLSEDIASPISINGTAVNLTYRIGQNARLPFEGTAGQRVSVGLSDMTLGVGYCCEVGSISLLKPDGTVLQAAVNFSNAGAGTASVLLPVSGTYAIFIDPSIHRSGAMTVTLSEDIASPISINGIAVNLTYRIGQNARLPFEGTAGQRVSVGLSDMTLGVGYCCEVGSISLLKPDGTVLQAAVNFSNAGAGTASVLLPVSGTYAIFIDPSIHRSGAMTVTLSEDLAPPITVNGPVVTTTYRIGQNATLTFEGTASQQITVRITGNTAGHIVVTLLKPDGTTLTSGNSSNSSFNLAAQTLPTTGTYTVRIDPNSSNTGNVGVSLYDPALANVNNLAYNKTATQSSTNFSAAASRAVDGNTSGNWNDGSVTHTAVQNTAWWHVDLGSVESIGNIELWNRTDCCGSALTNFYVFVSDVPFISTDLTTTINQSGVWSTNVSGQGGTPTTLTVNRTGRYVRVQLVSTSERLSLAEVQVWRP